MRKRDFRRLWIVRINAACRARGIRYSAFIAGLTNAMVILNRKSLSEIAIHDATGFASIAGLAKSKLA